VTTDPTSIRLVEALRVLAEPGNEQKGVAEIFRDVPVTIRAALAAVALAAADRPVNGINVSKAAGYSRGTAYRHNAEALEVVLSASPALAAALLERPTVGRSVTELSQMLQGRDRVIDDLRRQLKVARAERDMTLSYARDLHEQLAPEHDVIVQERKKKVRPLRVIDEPSQDPEL
jgi:hypothetical protein